MAHDLDEANAVRSARNMGFDGTFPLQEQQDYTANQKLEQLLAPKRLDVEASREDNAFRAHESQLGREAALQRTNIAQSGMNNRAAQNRAHAVNMAKQKGQIQGPSWLASLFGMGGSQADATVQMQTPSGDIVEVPESEAAEAEANGAIRIG